MGRDHHSLAGGVIKQASHTKQRKGETMQRQKVESSQIVSIGFEADKNQMDVEFKSGSVYRYDNVTPVQHISLMSSESKGKFFGEFIKKDPERFPFKKVRPPNREIEKHKKDGFKWNEDLLIYEKEESFL